MKVISIVQRLGEIPARAEALVRERSEVSDRLHRALDVQKEIEVRVAGEVAGARGPDGKATFPNEALRMMETSRRLAASGEYQQVLQEVDQARRRLRELDAQLESIRRRHDSDLALTGLITALITAGRGAEASSVLATYLGKETTDEATAPTEETTTTTVAAPGAEDDTIMVTVLEARPGKTEGTVRAWCQLSDGRNVAVFGKNGTGQALAAALGKQVRMRVRPGNAGYIALRVEPA